MLQQGLHSGVPFDLIPGSYLVLRFPKNTAATVFNSIRAHMYCARHQKGKTMSTRPWADNLSSEEKTQVGLCGLGVLAGALLCTVAPQIGLPIAITSAAGFFKGGYDSASKGEDVFEGGVRGAIAGAVTGAAGAAV